MTLKCLCCLLNAIWCAPVCVFLFSCVYLVPPFPCFKIFSSRALHLRKLKLSVISSSADPPTRPDAVKSPQWAQPASKHLQAVLPSGYNFSLLSEILASAGRQVSSWMWNRTPKALGELWNCLVWVYKSIQGAPYPYSPAECGFNKCFPWSLPRFLFK